MIKKEIEQSIKIIDEMLTEYRKDYIKKVCEKATNDETSNRITTWEINKSIYQQDLNKIIADDKKDLETKQKLYNEN